MAVVAAMNTGFDYYGTFPVQNSIESTKLLRLSPVTALTANTPFEFVLEGGEVENQFLDLANSYFYFKVQAHAADGTTAIADADKVSCIQNLGHSMFTRVEASIQDKTINDPHGYYPFTSYIIDLLNNSRDAKETWMRAQGWVGRDSTFATVDTASTTDKGVAPRGALIGQSNNIELIVKPHIEIFNTDKYLPPGLKVKVRFYPAPANLFLKSGKLTNNAADPLAATFKIKEAFWYVPTVKATQSQMKALFEALRSIGPYRINFTRLTAKTLALPQGSTTGNLDNLIIGPIPNRIIIAMVRSSNFAGGYTTYPFKFETFDVSNIAINCNGNQIPSLEYRPVFTTGSAAYLREYYEFLMALNKQKNQLGSPDIKYEDYVTGFCFWVFDLTPDRNSERSHSPLGEGQTRLELAFRTALPAAVTVLALTEYDAWVEIDQLKQIRTSFG